MTTRIAINGFGRIGRQVLRQISLGHPELEVVAINSSRTTGKMAAHMFMYDSVHGRYTGKVDFDSQNLIVDGRVIRVTDQRDPLLCPWHAFGVDIVVEATGHFNHREAAAKHLKAGANKVVITAPGQYEDVTLVVGVNEHIYDHDRHHIISAASCTTNCLAPMLKVLHRDFGVEGALMTTIHAYTRDQQLLDGTHSDPRRARAATLNMTPTKTGAAKAIDKVMPELAGRIVGIAVRVPVADVSLVDLSVTLSRHTMTEEINDAYKAAALSPEMSNVLDVTVEPLVSSDFAGDTHSTVMDLASTRRGPGTQLKVLAWYDNEAGYSARVVDICSMIAAEEAKRCGDAFVPEETASAGAETADPAANGKAKVTVTG
ncbi:MAG: type I glyceraldehyde-3-phosphate dehydrogenase [Actinomycetota bacterium]